MKAISLLQPWAQWVELGWKTVETRRHSRFACLVGHAIVIHAAHKWDPDWIEKSKGLLTAAQFDETVEQCLHWHRGALLCTVRVVGHYQLGAPASPLALCDCSDGRLFGLVIADVHRLAPTPFRGKQGIFEVPDEIICGNVEAKNEIWDE